MLNNLAAIAVTDFDSPVEVVDWLTAHSTVQITAVLLSGNTFFIFYNE